MLGICLSAQAAYAQNNAAAELKKEFAAQVTQSAKSGFTYTKRVTDPDGAATDADTKIYRVVLAAQPQMLPTAGDPAKPRNFAEELSYAVEYVAQDPAQAANFDVRQNGDTVMAAIRPALAHKSDLQAQKVVRKGGIVRYVETAIVRNTLMFTTHIDARVFFNEKGLYQKHTLFFRTTIRVLGTHSGAFIEGSAAYAVQ